MPTKAIIVARRSTDRQDISLEAQISECEQLAAANGWEVAGIFTDTASGSSSLDLRPGLMKALDALERGDVLIARSASRISRKIGIHLAIEDEVATRKARIYYCDGGEAGENPEKVLLLRIRQSIAEYELALISLRTKSALAKLRRDKRALGSPDRVRFGFQVSEDGKSLVEKPEEMKCLEKIWTLKSNGLNGNQITQVLAAEGFKTRKGKPIHFTGVYRLLRNLKDHPELYPFLQTQEAS